ncbi:MAG: glycosyltransferase [Caldithrix sp.]|nr:glycosyltransferase [Caldithrix sp.]
MDVSIVVPLLNEQDSLPLLTEKIDQQMQAVQKAYELIFVDDGSTDDSFEVLQDLKAKYDSIRIVRFRKNFGKSAALAEGFKRTTGNIVITMDADLQDDPAEIPHLISALDSGYDLVSGWKKKRHDPITKTLPSKFFNYTTRVLTGIRIHDFNCGLKAYRQEVIKTIPVYGELHRYLPVLAHWHGFRVGEIVVQHHARQFGKTKFGMRRFLHGFFDLLTVLFITRYRHKPLHLFGSIGMAFTLVGLIILIYLTVIWFQGHGIGQRPLFFLGILLMIVGVQFFSLGLIGEMLTSSKSKEQEYGIIEEID